MDPAKKARFIRVCLCLIALLMAFGVGMAMQGCSDGPFGRFQVRALSPQQESEIGQQVFDQFMRQAEVVRTGPQSDAVERVGRRLADAASDKEVRGHLRLKKESFQWSFRLVDEDEVNAFCIPGGKVVVCTGLLRVARTEGGLAAVLGHEIGHALAHHAAERLYENMIAGLGATILPGSLGADIDGQQAAAVLGLPHQSKVELAFSREHESEADHIGLVLLAAAGYEPKEVLRLWERMKAVRVGARLAEFDSTHPSDEHRLADLNGWMPEVQPLYEQSTKQDTGKLLP